MEGELSELLRVRQAEGNERHALLSSIANKLATKYLRSRDAPHDEATRVITVLAHFAEKQPGAFGWGEPAKLATTALGLIEQLPVQSEEHHAAVLSALSSILELLCVGCARTFACFAREALDLLSRVAGLRVADYAGAGGLRLCGFESFAHGCAHGVAPAAIHLTCTAACAWLHGGLLVACAQLHAIGSQFIESGSHTLWAALLDALDVRRLPRLPPPVRLAPLRALRHLLQPQAAPAPLRSRLAHQLLLLLCVGSPSPEPVPEPDGSVASEGLECDELVGECLHSLIQSGIPPPLASLPALRCALPWALASSRSSRLHAVLCELLCALPVEALAPQLLLLERFLPVRSMQHALLPCFEAALLRTLPAASDGEAAGGGEAEAQQDAEPPAKRERGLGRAHAREEAVEMVRVRLHERAVGLQMEGEIEADLASLSTLGAITCLLLRLVEWIDRVIERTISCFHVGSLSNEHDLALLSVSFDVARDLVSCLSANSSPLCEDESVRVYTAMARIATLPWTPPAASSAVAADWTSSFGEQICTDALRLLTMIPPDTAPHVRVRALHAAIHGSFTGDAVKLAVAARALEALPSLVGQLRFALDACAPLKAVLQELVACCPPPLCEAVGHTLGDLVQLCAAPREASTQVDAHAADMQFQLSRLIPKVWEMQLRLPLDEWRQRTALVSAVARMMAYGDPVQIARQGDVLVQLMALLGDENDRVRAACSKVLPELLGCKNIVGAVLQLPEGEPISAETLRSQIIEPMAEAMRQRRGEEPQVMLCMMETLGAVCCQELYASDECRAAVVLALCDGLEADQLGREYGLAMQQLHSIARTCTESKTTTVAMCRRLAPLLAVEWGWWLHERPQLLALVAEKLLDCDECDLVKLIAPHFIPHVTMLGAIEMEYPCKAGVLSDIDRARGKVASKVLHSLAAHLGKAEKELLVENMHLILAEVFSRQAADDSLDDNDVNLIHASLEFMYCSGVARKEHLTAMIRMNSRELMQEMVLRLGRARGDGEVNKVLMALNLLIPAGLHVAEDELTNNRVSLMSSLDVNGSNTQLRSYIDANSLMLIQFLRNKLTSRSALLRDKEVTLCALHRLLLIMEDDGGVPPGWWGEMVATLKLALKLEALQPQALSVVSVYASLIDTDQLRLGLQQLVLMLLPCLRQHTRQVVQILERLIVDKHKSGMPDGLAHALSEITFIPDHPALATVHAVLREYVRHPGLAQQLKGCARGLAHESVSVRLMALQQLLDALQNENRSQLHDLLLSTNPLVSALVSELLHRLLRCCGECHNAASSSSATQVQELWQPAATLALQCLGEIGAVDPARVGVSSAPRGHARAASAGREKGWVSDEELCARLLERHLVKTLRGAYEGQVPPAAYACTVLLQDICKCTAETPYAQYQQPPPDRATRFWMMLQESTRHTLRPFLQLRAVLPPHAAAGPEPTPIFRRGIRYSDWLARWSRQLQHQAVVLREGGQLDEAQAQRAQLLLACAPCFDFDHHLALHLLPYNMMLLLCVDRAASVHAIQSEVDAVLVHITACKEYFPAEDSAERNEWDAGRPRGEGGDEAEDQLCCGAVFSVLDALQEWRAQQRKRGSELYVVECIDALLDAISFTKLAQAALHCNAHCRSLLYMEQSLEQQSLQPTRFLSGREKEQRQLTFDEAALMLAAYVRTDEPDGLLALARLRAPPTLEEEVLEHESHGRYSAALNCYQVALQPRHRAAGVRQTTALADPTLPAPAGRLLRWQLGLCRSLRCLGLFVSMRDSAEAMLRAAATEFERAHLRPCALQAAWRLGEWADVQRLLHSSAASAAAGGSATFETELAHAMLALHRADWEALHRHCGAARLSLLPLVAAAGMESYGRAHAHLTQLHALQELQAAARLAFGPHADGAPLAPPIRSLTSHWRRRLALVPDTPQALEPILAVRCAALSELSSRCGGGVALVADAALAQGWLAFAKAARAAGHTETAANALAQAALFDAGSAALKAAKMDWEAGRSHHAILRLQQLLRDVRPAEEKASRAKVLLLLARYLEDERGLSEPETVLDLLDEAAKAQPEWEKCHFCLGHFMDRILAEALLQADRTEVVQQGKLPGHRSEFGKRQVSPQERQAKKLEAYHAHLHGTIRAYGAALKRGMRHSALALPRMLTLWLDFADLQLLLEGAVPKRKTEPIHDAMAELMKSVPLHQWLPATAQLVSRICHRLQRVREMLHTQLAKLLAEFPYQLVWSVIPVSLSTIAERKRSGESIVARAKQLLISAAPEQQELMGQASRLIDQLRKVCNDPLADKREKRVQMQSRWPLLYRMTGLQVVVPLHSSLTVSEPAPHVSVASHSPFSADAPTIEKWVDDVDVMGSLQRPKKVTIHGSDGRLHPFLCKPKDDLRKDARMMELMTAVNRMLHKSSGCRRRRLAVRCYAVVPLDQECGLIEWVPNMLQLRSIIKEYWEACGVPFNHARIKSRHQQAMEQPDTKKVSSLCALVQSLMAEMPPVLHHWFVDTFRTPSAWFDARLSFTRSCSVMSMIGYAVGLGDRHLENILIDATSGSVMHVDFACLFDHGLNLETPEKVPFRLTQNLLHAMGILGADGAFRQVCELTLEQLRNNRETLLNVLSTMRHDPLVEWSKRNAKEDASGAKDSKEATRELDKIDQKLQGVMQLRGPTPLSVQGQVQQLINDATDIVNLGQMYLWWMPWC
ncbi:hypothetical protein AB1Y20_019502 [Prymnesium parvum]|uniref:non-specific serine/threonine protein kinase n=1 Tax=Prymnesium parvum TaxID=97485 RepID=A0AB34JRA8_PRYPA